MKHVILTFFLLSLKFIISAQSIPIGQCGLQYIYDATGNLVSREYVCNNMQAVEKKDNTLKEQGNNVIVQQIDALYPNPTTGKFSVRFSIPLEDAVVRILDLNGRVLQQFKVSGALINCNLGSSASGTYYVQVLDKNTNVFQKVLKQ